MTPNRNLTITQRMLEELIEREVTPYQHIVRELANIYSVREDPVRILRLVNRARELTHDDTLRKERLRHE